MSLLRFPWRLFAALMWVSPLVFITGCGTVTQQSDVPSTAVAISGKVTFVRPPLLTDANGVPTGLETDPTKFLTQPAAGVLVRFVKSVEETQPDGTKITVWNTLDGLSQYTTTEGAYSAQIPKGDKVFVEILSRIQPTGSSVRILADAAGMYSSTNQADRTLYSLRKGLDGTTASSLPGTLASETAVVNFEVGLNDKWWTTLEAPSKVNTAVLEETGTGSRVLAIAHSLMTFSTHYGSPAPGAPLDLHYRRGVAETRGSFVEYDRDLTPLSYDSVTSTRHYFGSIRGSQANDDAFDEGILFPMFARNRMAAFNTSTLLTVDAKLNHLSPALALVEGFPRAMASILVKSPYLADTTASGVVNQDIRDIAGITPADRSPFSAPLITALSWEIALKGASLPTPGTPTDWAKLDPLTLQRYFIPLVATDTAGLPLDLVSLYSQLNRLKETKASGETIDLAAIFTDAVLTPFLAPFNIAWPRPETGAVSSFLLDWGKDPNSLATPLPALAFSMAQAEWVRGSYPNVSEGEVRYARITLSKDTPYNLYVTLSSPLPADAKIEIQIDGFRTFSFDSTTPSARVILHGDSTTAVLHTFRIRVVSPLVRITDTQATVHLDVAP